jgi:hypothetical protein
MRTSPGLSVQLRVRVTGFGPSGSDQPTGRLAFSSPIRTTSPVHRMKVDNQVR